MTLNISLKSKFLIVFLILLSTVMLRLLLPKQLQRVDVYHLTRLLHDQQDFHTESVSLETKTFAIQVNETPIITHLLKMGDLLPNDTDYDSDSIINYFKPVYTFNDRAVVLITLETFVRACRLENLVYFLWGGSMLGVYRHQGFIPWDDDFDLVMNASDWRRIRNVLSNIEGYTLDAPGDHQWKFFKTDLPSAAGVTKHKWPFIDIFFFNEDSTYIWALTQSIKNELAVPREDIFPVQLRLFENLRVAVPCNMEDLVLRTYGKDCLSLDFSHKMTKTIAASRVKLIPCSMLYNFYPFVFRHKDPNAGNVIETLKRGDTVYRTISVPQS